MYFRKAAALAAGAALALSLGVDAFAKNATTVSIVNDAFNPATISVSSGQTVTFVNADDDAHTVTADNNAFDSKPISHGGKFLFKFTKPGRYTYHCTIHPFMHGIVVVK